MNGCLVDNLKDYSKKAYFGESSNCISCLSLPSLSQSFDLSQHENDSNLGFQVLQTLLTSNGVDVTIQDGDGRQPLLWAASAGSAKAILALFRAGSPVEAADKDGLTALHCAASRGHTDCIDTLLTLCGASCDIIDSNGCTALHYAVTLGNFNSKSTSLLIQFDLLFLSLQCLYFA